jgi:hypothetical protein
LVGWGEVRFSKDLYDADIDDPPHTSHTGGEHHLVTWLRHITVVERFPTTLVKKLSSWIG